MKDLLNHKNIMYVLIILVLYTAIALLYSRVKYVNEKIIEVSNYSKFYTLANSASMYVSYVGIEDSKSVLTLLNDDYVKEHELTFSNVISKVKDFDTSLPSFRVTKMLEQITGKSTKRYYLKGNLVDLSEDVYNVLKDYYLIMDLDENNNTYQITPYNGEIFVEGQYEQK